MGCRHDAYYAGVSSEGVYMNVVGSVSCSEKEVRCLHDITLPSLEKKVEAINNEIKKRVLVLRRLEKCFADIADNPRGLNASEYLGALCRCSNERHFLENLQLKIDDNYPQQALALNR